jgi:hypothetical protein
MNQKSSNKNERRKMIQRKIYSTHKREEEITIAGAKKIKIKIKIKK